MRNNWYIDKRIIRIQQKKNLRSESKCGKYEMLTGVFSLRQWASSRRLDQTGLLFDPQQTGTVVQIHQGRLKTGFYKTELEVIKEYGPIRPGEFFSFLFEELPFISELRIFSENVVFGTVAKVHLAHNRFETPQATVFGQIHAFETLVGFIENCQ